jgi:hypothetical protein
MEAFAYGGLDDLFQRVNGMGAELARVTVM